jgi:hypothetical protein
MVESWMVFFHSMG